MTKLPSGTVTFLFTDIEDSTRRWEARPDAMKAALKRHDMLLRTAIESQGGRVFKTIGDAFCAAFDTPHAALRAAVDAQLALHAADWSEVDGLPVRMSLHSGVADERDEDYFGPVLNRVARQLGVANGHQILVSSVTEALVSDGLPASVTLRDLGEHRLRDLGRSERIFQVLHPDLPETFPPLRSLSAFHHNLPAQVSSFVGREREIQEVLALVRKARMLTLTGFGGSGKTRLALQVAAELLEAFPDGVWLIPLAPISDPALIASTIATTLGLVESPGQPVEVALEEHLEERRTLLLLDNCEHLIDGCASLAQRLLGASPGLTILATSREPLRIAGEKAWTVPPLDLPDAAGAGETVDVEAMERCESVRLFVERAVLVKPGFALTEENAAAVGEICRRLDGIALAIELAATRSRSMAPQQIADRLAQRFRLLTGGSRTALPHQKTLRAALDWSHDLLDAREQRLLRRLSVFAGGWEVEAAEHVCPDQGPEVLRELPVAADDAPIEDWDVLDLLGQLLDKSLVTIGDDESIRHEMLETVRDYGAEKLEESGEVSVLEERHAHHFLTLAESAEPELFGPRSTYWRERFDTERANLRKAMAWFIDAGEVEPALRLGGALWRYWYLRSNFIEGREEIERALALPGGEPQSAARAKALHGIGTLATFQGDFDAAQEWLNQSLAIWHALGDETGAAGTAHNLAIVVHEQGQFSTARTLMEEYLEFASAAGDQLGMAIAHNNIATAALEFGDLDAAEAGFRNSLNIYRDLEDANGVAAGYRYLGTVALDRGDYSEARRLVDKGRQRSLELEDRRGVAECLLSLGEIAHREGDLSEARGHYVDSLSMEREMGNRLGEAFILGSLGQLELDHGVEAVAREYLRSSLEILEAIGQKRSLASSLNGLGYLSTQSGELDVARELLGRALELRREMESPLHLVASYEALIGLAVAAEHHDLALRMAGAASAIRERLGAPIAPVRSGFLDQHIMTARLALGEEASEKELYAGREMNDEAALETAFEIVGRAPVKPDAGAQD